MRLSEIADHLTEIENRESDELHIKLRNPLFKGLMTGTPGRSRNSPQEYQPEELARARLLLALQDVGLNTTDLTPANHALNQPVWAVHPLPASVAELDGLVPSTLRCMIRGARVDEPWHVRVRFVRLPNGGRDVRVRVDCGPMTVGEESKRAQAALNMVDGETTTATLFVDATDLIKPLLRFMPEGEA